MTFWNRRVRSLDPYVPGEQPRQGGLVKLNTNENPYPPSPLVLEAVRAAANGNLRLYPDPACTEFRSAVAARYGVALDQVFAGNGSDEVLGFAFGAFFESEDLPVLFPDVTYTFYPVYAKLWDVPFRTVRLDDDFSIDVDGYAPPRGGAVIANPNAPTGIALPAVALLDLAGKLAKEGQVLIVDEAYVEFGAESVVGYVSDFDNLLVVRTLSKSASLAGLRAGYAVASERLIEGLCRVRDSFNSYTLDRLAIAGATAAINGAAYYAEVNGKVIATRDRVAAELTGTGFTVLPSSANFLFVKPPPPLTGAGVFAELRRRGILVRHFDRERIADFLRVSIGTDGEMDLFLTACGEITGGRSW